MKITVKGKYDDFKFFDAWNLSFIFFINSAAPRKLYYYLLILFSKYEKNSKILILLKRACFECVLVLQRCKPGIDNIIVVNKE